MLISVFGSIFSENVAVTTVLRATFFAPLVGLTLLTLGAVLSTVTLSVVAEEVLPAASLAVAE